MDELLLDFVTESKEHLESIEDDFVMMGQLKDTPDPELANKVFRAIHTIKGVAGFVGQKNIGELSHVMESILQKIKLDEMLAELEVINALLKGVDYLNGMLDDIEEANSVDISEPMAILEALLKGERGLSSKSDEKESLIISLDDPVKEQGAEVQKDEAPKTEECSPKPAKESTPVSPAFPQINLDDIPEIEITDDMRTKFVQESMDLLDAGEASLISIEQPDHSEEQVHEAFRAIHSFKGNCGFFGLVEFESISHKLENKLEGLLDGSIMAEPSTISLFLEIVDYLRNELIKYSESGVVAQMVGIHGILDLLDDVTQVMVETDVPETVVSVVNEEQVIETNQDIIPVIPAVINDVAEDNTENVPVEASSDKKEKEPKKAAASVRQDIRVDLSKLDSLINLVGELVIAETMVVKHPILSDIEDESLERAIHHLDRISSDLQDIAMSVRMIPLATTFRKMTRLVYDLSNKNGKNVELKLIGEDTEVDKTVIESIGDPLVHIVRNAIDHGLENPQERAQSSKPLKGTVIIEARHEGGEVLIFIRDDGKGLNKDKILKKATERQLISGDGSELRDEDVFKLIFEPGFSTADKITDISGRGVGMDVVKRNIEKLKGRIEVRSIEGEGTTFVMHIPLTLAIIDGMLVRVGDAQYTLPLLSIRESLRPSIDMITNTPDGQEIVRIRDEMIPVLRLHKLYSKVPQFTNLDEGLLVIVESGSSALALFVDELLGQQQTVIKPLSNYLGESRAVSGCTILGNGEVSLILDVASLFEASNDV